MTPRRYIVFSDALFELLKDAVGAASAVTDKYAIGGAVGMASYGYARQTGDVDLFIDDKARTDVLKELRARGFRVATIFDGIHYIAQRPNSADPDERIDVLVPFDDPDWSAVESPEQGMIGDLVFNVFPAELLALSKFYGAEEDPQHRADIYKMLHRGIFDTNKARRILQEMDADRVPEWDALITEFEKPRTPRRPKPPRKKRPTLAE